MEYTTEKIQTGLRNPANRYAELSKLAEETGISLNSLILALVDLGLSVRNGRLFLQKES